MKKKLTALLCTAALLLSLLAVPASAGNSLFFLSLNDTLAPQSAQTTPIQHGGWVYVPVTAFSSRVTGVNFGIYYGFSESGDNLMFYNLSGKTMTFDLINGTATAVNSDPPVPGTVVRQNGIYYVPAYALCRYFGLTYSFYNTEYGPLLRMKDGNVILSDSLFISSASSMMRSQYNSYNQSQNSSGTTTPTTPSTPQPVTPEPVENAPKFSLYLGLRANGETDLTAALNALASVQATAVVFFPADKLTDCAGQLRQAAGRGHKVGLIPAGDTPQEKLESIRAGSRLVAQILRQEVWFVLGSDQTLSDAGYLCWSPGLTPSAGGTAAEIYESIVSFGGRTSSGWVLLDCRTARTVLSGVLSRLSQDGDTFLSPRETRY